MRLAGARWPEVDADPGPLVVPLGATEQHGPHLPLGTDTAVIEAVADRFERLRPDAWLAPALPFGASGEHAGFPGTLSLGSEALALCLVELARSADAFPATLFACWHGGNGDALERALATLRAEGRFVDVWRASHVGGDLHAGRTETSLMLAICPRAVELAEARAGGDLDPRTLWPRLRTDGVRGVSPNGVLGDPAGATAAEGERLLDRLARDLAAAYGALADRLEGRDERVA